MVKEINFVKRELFRVCEDREGDLVIMFGNKMASFLRNDITDMFIKEFECSEATISEMKDECLAMAQLLKKHI